MNLLEALKSVPDYRSSRGKRHPLWLILLLIVMGNLAGYRGNRPLAAFAQRYGGQIARLLQVDLRSLPSFSTFRRVYRDLDFETLSQAVSGWMRAHLSPDEDCFAIDGKRIGQPIADADGKTRFVGLVSVFAQSQGMTAALAALTVADNSELKVVQYLLEKLQLSGVLLSLDALHAQKNA
jgi:hypothetical protein